MSRRDPRIRAHLTATVTLEDSDDVIVCRTRDISHRGCFLDTAQLISPGRRVHMALLDQMRGVAMEVDGHVTRCLPPGTDGLGRGVGVRFDNPPPEWSILVQSYQSEQRPSTQPPRRLRVLVVGDRARQRGAMALYVTSGWDVRFASELEGVEDALSGVALDAVIAESDMEDDRWKEIMALARRLQPDARRIVRSTLHGQATPRSSGIQDLFHRVVDRDDGLEPLLDALTAEI
jgi:Tfp pilus assembly protein PilZ